MPAALEPRSAYIALGANLGDPPGQLRCALRQLAAEPAIRVTAVSNFYRSAPMGPAGQPDYCNAVCAIWTKLPADALLNLLHIIERRAGRVRDVRWGPRVLDLDLLHVDGVTSGSADLTLPHPHLHERNFVLVPFAEIAPELTLPGLGGLAALAAACDRAGLGPWD
jgi:2-amino-4-hydroxy-6-hydroxymethyldihydropteridine diphosphokinase